MRRLEQPLLAALQIYITEPEVHAQAATVSAFCLNTGCLLHSICKNPLLARKTNVHFFLIE